MKIRKANMQDLKQISALEACCFPYAEAASEENFRRRLETFPECFLVMQKGNDIIAMINGSITNRKTICDDLYVDMSKHDPCGRYQAVFGLDVHPDHRHQGYAHTLMNAFLAMAKANRRSGVILTCKKEKISFYEGMGFHCLGVSASTHGNAEWYDMLIEFS